MNWVLGRHSSRGIVSS
ncbi:hypothetical protein Patl1_34831 [Pistacia atlantica]|uniref:Uncharacterized protein n=1 Tax=Pistacia atlantica TaxID=434234 RepID=A0ACC0ZRH5_9ROSI|nr:hypothetical protein Patl1_34831 [Pistacia atlantica]